jgi:hypothetical protein
MSAKQKRGITRAASRNLTLMTKNTSRAAELGVTAAEVIARRTSMPATPLEGTMMVLEKMMAAQTGWWGLDAVMADAGPKLARSGMTTSGAMGRGPLALGNAMLAGSVEMTTTMLNAQRAIMAPMWSAVHANSVRLGKSAR